MQQEASGLQSLAAEGDILATDAAQGHLTAAFERVQAAALAKAARASAALLGRGRTAEARALAALAVRVSSRLERLSHSGSDRAEQRSIATELERAAAKASKLGKRL